MNAARWLYKCGRDSAMVRRNYALLASVKTRIKWIRRVAYRRTLTLGYWSRAFR